VLGSTNAAATIAGEYKRHRTCTIEAIIGVGYSIRNVGNARRGSCITLSPFTSNA
jgi:hypothetical protein